LIAKIEAVKQGIIMIFLFKELRNELITGEPE